MVTMSIDPPDSTVMYYDLIHKESIKRSFFSRSLHESLLDPGWVMHPFLKNQKIKLFLISLGLKQNAQLLYPEIGTQTEIKAGSQEKELVVG